MNHALNERSVPTVLRLLARGYDTTIPNVRIQVLDQIYGAF